jgi:transcription initiation factor IIE alpha subunit
LQITAIKKGFEWINERSIIATKSYKSLPDGLLVVVPNSYLISIEYQRNRLNLQTLKSKIAKCLADIINKKFRSVLYVCSDNLNAELMQRAFDSIKFIKTKTDADIEFNDGYRAKFKCINLNEFDDYIATLTVKKEV